MSTGFSSIFDFEPSTGHRLWIIAAVSVAATFSVATGVRRGVRILSEINLWLTMAIMAFFFFFGAGHYQMSLLVQSTGDYLQHLVELTFGPLVTMEPTGSHVGPFFSGVGGSPGHPLSGCSLPECRGDERSGSLFSV